MTNADFPRDAEGDDETRKHIIHLVESALELCDKAGYIFVAIDLSLARDKLENLKGANP